MAVFYMASVVGMHSLLTYYRNVEQWDRTVTQNQMLDIVRTYIILSYILIALTVFMKLTGFILYRIKNERLVAKTLITLSSVSIGLKIAAIIVAIPVYPYIGSTSANMQLKFFFNILFIVAQSAIIAWTVIYLKSYSSNR